MPDSDKVIAQSAMNKASSQEGIALPKGGFTSIVEAIQTGGAAQEKDGIPSTDECPANERSYGSLASGRSRRK